jgi:hypothetical protein
MHEEDLDNMWWESSPPLQLDENSRWAAARLFNNAQDFLNEGLQLLFASGPTTSTWKLSVVAIQTAVELLAKYRLVSQLGLNSITEGQVVPLSKLQTGDFRSISYGKVLDQLKEVEAFNEYDLDVIADVQRLRNKLVHFTADVTSEQAYSNCCSLLVRALCLFADGDRRDAGEMTDHRRFLTSENYERLIASDQYRVEAFDFATDSTDDGRIVRCWNCRNETLGFSSYTESYYCYCCGFSIGSDTVGFTRCTHCKKDDGVYFDALNNDEKAFHHGKCGYCDTSQFVFVCPECEAFRAVASNTHSVRCLECS